MVQETGGQLSTSGEAGRGRKCLNDVGYSRLLQSMDVSNATSATSICSAAKTVTLTARRGVISTETGSIPAVLNERQLTSCTSAVIPPAFLTTPRTSLMMTTNQDRGAGGGGAFSTKSVILIPNREATGPGPKDGRYSPGETVPTAPVKKACEGGGETAIITANSKPALNSKPPTGLRVISADKLMGGSPQNSGRPADNDDVAKSSLPHGVSVTLSQKNSGNEVCPATKAEKSSKSVILLENKHFTKALVMSTHSHRILPASVTTSLTPTTPHPQPAAKKPAKLPGRSQPSGGRKQTLAPRSLSSTATAPLSSTTNTSVIRSKATRGGQRLAKQPEVDSREKLQMVVELGRKDLARMMSITSTTTMTTGVSRGGATGGRGRRRRKQNVVASTGCQPARCSNSTSSQPARCSNGISTNQTSTNGFPIILPKQTSRGGKQGRVSVLTAVKLVKKKVPTATSVVLKKPNCGAVDLSRGVARPVILNSVIATTAPFHQKSPNSISTSGHVPGISGHLSTTYGHAVLSSNVHNASTSGRVAPTSGPAVSTPSSNHLDCHSPLNLVTRANTSPRVKEEPDSEGTEGPTVTDREEDIGAATQAMPPPHRLPRQEQRLILIQPGGDSPIRPQSEKKHSTILKRKTSEEESAEKRRREVDFPPPATDGTCSDCGQCVQREHVCPRKRGDKGEIICSRCLRSYCNMERHICDNREGALSTTEVKEELPDDEITDMSEKVKVEIKEEPDDDYNEPVNLIVGCDLDDDTPSNFVIDEEDSLGEELDEELDDDEEAFMREDPLHSPQDQDQEPELELKTGFCLLCRFCKRYLSGLEAADHFNVCSGVEGTTNRTYNCPHCVKIFNAKFYLGKHVHTAHLKRKEKCNICGVRFINLKSHQDKYHNFKNVDTCSLCGKIVKHLSAHHCPLEKNPRHKRDFAVDCPSCGNLVKQKYLKIHQRSHCVGIKSSTFSNFRTENPGKQIKFESTSEQKSALIKDSDDLKPEDLSQKAKSRPVILRQGKNDAGKEGRATIVLKSATRGEDCRAAVVLKSATRGPKEKGVLLVPR